LKISGIVNQQYNGIWQFDKNETTDIPSVVGISDTYTFIYEQDSVIIHLPTMTTVIGLPEDFIYRIAVRWKGDELYIFLPLGDKWELFANWEHNRFVMYGDRIKKIFKRIRPEEIAIWYKALLNPERPMWKYKFMDPASVDL
jgi:hypothetical protein